MVNKFLEFGKTKFKNETDNSKKITELKYLLYLDLGKDILNSYKILKYLSDNEESKNFYGK